MSELSYYEILDVSKSATTAEIKKAYKKLAMEYHPDRNPDNAQAEEKFKEVNEAYQVLGDESKRATYDQFGKAGLEGQSFGGQGDFGDMFSGMGDIGDIFGEFFGGSSRRSQKRERRPYQLDSLIEIKLSFKEAIFGCKKKVNYSYKTPCDSCNATGAKNGELSSCTTCDGQGQVYMRQSFMTIQQTCPDCNGVGQKSKANCGDCKGQGYQVNKEEIEIEVPEGVDEGMQIRVQGKGSIYKGQRGDLYLQTSVKSR